MQAPPRVLCLSATDVARFLPPDACLAAVEEVFRRLGAGELPAPVSCAVPAGAGGFHVKAGLYATGRRYFVLKENGNFMGNPERHGLPSIQGLVILADAETGSPLAVLESGELTARRTAAATGVAAKHLARPDSRVATVWGCGRLGRATVGMLRRVLPLERIYLYDAAPGRAERTARELTAGVAAELVPVEAPGPALAGSDVVATCTPARTPVLTAGMLRPGQFLAATGADHPEKQELPAELLGRVTLVVDVLAQAAAYGELHHALAAGVLEPGDVHAELGEVVAGRKRGRRDEAEIVVFDSTGMALQDAAAAALVFEQVLAQEPDRPGFRFAD